MRVLVIGAGITGLTTAYYLNKQGYEVTVYDEEPSPAMKCSYANGGQVSVSNSEVWNTWTNVFKGVKWMFKKDAPLLIRPTFDLEKISWLTKFLYHTARNNYEKNTLATISMGLDAQKKYEEIVKETKIKFDKSNCGILHIYNKAKSFERAKQAGRLYTELGVDWQILDSNSLLKYNFRHNLVGGIYTETDWTGDIKKFSDGLAQYLKSQGVWFVYDEGHSKYVNDIYDCIVVCAGVGSKKIAKTYGDYLPIYPVKGYSVTIDEITKHFWGFPEVSIIDDDAKIVTSTLGDRLRIAGTAEFTGINYDIRRDRIDPLLKWSKKTLGIRVNKYSQWACLRPMTPNMFPIVKQSKKNPKVFYNTGHGHLGWTLAPHTADLIVRKINAGVQFK